MRLCHRFGLKRVAKLLMLRDERHRSFFLFLAVLRAVVQGYVKNIETTYCGKSCRLLSRQVDAKPTFQSTHFIKCDLHQFRCNDSNAMPTTQFSSCCKREVKINMQFASSDATLPTGFDPVFQSTHPTRVRYETKGPYDNKSLSHGYNVSMTMDRSQVCRR